MDEPLIKRILTDPTAAAKDHRKADIPPAVLRELCDQVERPQIRCFLARYAGTPGRILERLPQADDDRETRQALAEHPRAPAALLARLATDENREVRMAVAGNRALTPRVALALASDRDWRVRRALAENPALTARIQQRLAADDMPMVRSALLTQPRLDPDALGNLLDDSDLGVRARALLSNCMDEERLVETADSDRQTDQALLLQRQTLPDSVLESLSFSSHETVHRGALARKALALDEWVGWAKEGTPTVRAQIAARETIPAPVQEMLANDPDSTVRTALAANPALRPLVTAALADDTASDVRLALATNPRTPARTLTRLLLHDDPELRKCIARRNDLLREHREFILGTADDDLIYHLALDAEADPNLPATYAHRLQEHGLPTLRAFAAAACCLTRTMIAGLMHDPAPRVRRSLCDNPRLDEERLETLCNDPDPGVAACARDILTRRRNQCAEPEAPLEATPSGPGASARTGVLRRLLGRMTPQTDQEDNEI